MVIESGVTGYITFHDCHVEKHTVAGPVSYIYKHDRQIAKSPMAPLLMNQNDHWQLHRLRHEV